MMRNVLLLTLCLWLPGCGSDDESSTEPGSCYLRQTLCEGCESYEEHLYCGTRNGCTEYCGVMSGRPTTAYCYWDPERTYCSGDLPAVDPGADVCAVRRTITCGGTPSTDNSCDPLCQRQPGTSSYDPSTDCLTEYGSARGIGKTCEEALADLATK